MTSFANYTDLKENVVDTVNLKNNNHEGTNEKSFPPAEADVGFI